MILFYKYLIHVVQGVWKVDEKYCGGIGENPKLGIKSYFYAA